MITSKALCSSPASSQAMVHSPFWWAIHVLIFGIFSNRNRPSRYGSLSPTIQMTMTRWSQNDIMQQSGINARVCVLAKAISFTCIIYPHLPSWPFSFQHFSLVPPLAISHSPRSSMASITRLQSCVKVLHHQAYKVSIYLSYRDDDDWTHAHQPDRSTSELLREYYPPRSGWAATAGTLVSMGVLGKLTFQPDTRHRLFFAKAPANTDIRIVTLKLAMELIARCGVVFYGGAAGGAISGRLAVAGKKPSIQQQQQ